MNKIKFWIIWVVVCSLMIFTLQNVKATCIDIAPTADSQINGNSPGSNYGTTAFLEVRVGSYKGLIAYNLTNITGAIDNATLNLYYFDYGDSNGAGSHLSIYNTSSFNELSVNWGNAPTEESFLASFNICGSRPCWNNILLNPTKIIKSMNYFIINNSDGLNPRFMSRENFFGTYGFYNPNNLTICTSPANPTTPIIYSPCNKTYTTDGSFIYDIPFNYTATSPNYDVLYYNVSVFDQSNNLIQIINESTIKENITSNVSITTNGSYKVQVIAIDGTLTNNSVCNFNVCLNNWIKLNSICVAGSSQITYRDLSNCSISFNVPVDNGTYESCSGTSNQNVTIANNPLYIGIDISNNLLNILLFVFLMIIAFLFCYKMAGIWKFTYSLFAILLYYFNIFLSDTIFSNVINAYYLESIIFQVVGWIGVIGFMLYGIYNLFVNN
jgi:hypothetical protein